MIRISRSHKSPSGFPEVLAVVTEHVVSPGGLDWIPGIMAGPAGAPPPAAYCFGPFRLRVAGRILEREGKRIQLTPKVIDTLLVLVENAPEVVTKDAIMAAVWPDVTVVESGLTRNISALRKAFDDEGEDASAYLETIPRRGYRFLAPITVEASLPASPLAQETPPPSMPLPAAVASGRPSRVVTALVAIFLLAAVAAGGWFAWRRNSPARRPNVEAEVRIGEHLLYKLAPEETVRAVSYFERAVAANPKSGNAHAGLSISLLHLATFGVKSIGEVMPAAEQHAARAMALDPRSSVAQYSHGVVLLLRDWNFKLAEEAFRRSLQLDPASVQTRIGYVRLHTALGRLQAAQHLVEDAIQLDPVSPPLGLEYCRTFYHQRDYRRAEAECRKVLDREPGFALAHYYLALSLGFLGQFEDARRRLDRSGLMPGVIEADHAWLSALEGDRRPAAALLERRRSLIQQGKIGASAKLLLAAMLDRRDEAFDAIEAGIKERAPELLVLKVEPRLATLREDPRFPEMLKRLAVSDR